MGADPHALAPEAVEHEVAALQAVGARLRAHRFDVASGVHYAGFLARFLAFAIDNIVLGAFAVPLGLAALAGARLGLTVLRIPPPVDVDETLESLFAIGWLAMAGVYFTALHRGGGQTIGKAIVGIRVRSLDLGPIGVARSLLRTIGYIASSAFFGFGFLLIALSPRKRGWHDHLAGTCVVHLAPDEA